MGAGRVPWRLIGNAAGIDRLSTHTPDRMSVTRASAAATPDGVAVFVAARLADVSSMPVGRTTTPEEVAELVLFLALPSTATITGCVIGV